MRLPWPFGRSTTAADTTPDSPAPVARCGPATPGVDGRLGARCHRSSERSARRRLVSASETFLEAVPGVHPLPPIVEPLGHDVTPSGPAGLVTAPVHAVPSLTSHASLVPPPVQRRPSRSPSRSRTFAAAGDRRHRRRRGLAPAPSASDRRSGSLGVVPSEATVQPPDRPLTRAEPSVSPVRRRRPLVGRRTQRPGVAEAAPPPRVRPRRPRRVRSSPGPRPVRLPLPSTPPVAGGRPAPRWVSVRPSPPRRAPRCRSPAPIPARRPVVTVSRSAPRLSRRPRAIPAPAAPVVRGVRADRRSRAPLRARRSSDGRPDRPRRRATVRTRPDASPPLRRPRSRLRRASRSCRGPPARPGEETRHRCRTPTHDGATAPSGGRRPVPTAPSRPALRGPTCRPRRPRRPLARQPPRRSVSPCGGPPTASTGTVRRSAARRRDPRSLRRSRVWRPTTRPRRSGAWPAADRRRSGSPPRGPPTSPRRGPSVAGPASAGGGDGSPRPVRRSVRPASAAPRTGARRGSHAAPILARPHATRPRRLRRRRCRSRFPAALAGHRRRPLTRPDRPGAGPARRRSSPRPRRPSSSGSTAPPRRRRRPVPAATPTSELDELARALFGRFRNRLRNEFIYEREAKGLTFDHS